MSTAHAPKSGPWPKRFAALARVEERHASHDQAQLDIVNSLATACAMC
ncbi:hypothetical protein [Polaromonas sp.]|nr:hypothetical protein [Polaromonas sp.]